MTRGRAAPTDTLKNNGPASETAKNESAALQAACVADSRANGIGPRMRASIRIGGSGPVAERDGPSRPAPKS